MCRILQTLFGRRASEPSRIRGRLLFPAVPTHEAPDDLLFEFGMFPVMRGVRYSVSEGVITRRDQGLWPTSTSREPQRNEWQDFWALVGLLSVQDWKSDYPDPRNCGVVTLDGKGWRFRLRYGSFVVSSRGRMGFPAIDSPHRTTTSSEALDQLQCELERLESAGA